MCKVDNNTCIMVDAKRYCIPFYQILDLDELYHKEYGCRKSPKNFSDLLEVVC